MSLSLPICITKLFVLYAHAEKECSRDLSLKQLLLYAPRLIWRLVSAALILVSREVSELQATYPVH